MAPAWVPEFGLSHENVGKRRVLGVFLVVIGCQYSISTIYMYPVCPGIATGCSNGYSSCNAPCNTLPQADPIPVSGVFQDVENRGTRDLYKDCNPGVGPLSSFGGNANAAIGSTDATCMVVGCKPAQCLHASYDCKSNSPKYPPFGGQGGAATAAPNTELNQQVKLSLGCVNKVWQTDQQPFAWLAFFIFEVTGVYLLFTKPRGRKQGEEDVDGKQIVSTLVLMYGLYIMANTVKIQLSCPGHTLSAGDTPKTSVSALFPGIPTDGTVAPNVPAGSSFKPQQGTFKQTNPIDPFDQYARNGRKPASKAGCIRDYPTEATLGFWYQNEITTTTTAPATTSPPTPPTPAPTPSQGPDSYDAVSSLGFCGSQSDGTQAILSGLGQQPSPFAMGLQNKLGCVQLGCGPKQCVIETQSCAGENGGRTTAPPTTAAPASTTTSATTTLGPSAFGNIGTENNRLRCVDATPSAAVTNPLELFYCILLILVGLFNLFFSSCSCSMPSMPSRGAPSTNQQAAQPTSVPSNPASVPSNPSASAWPDFCDKCGKPPGGSFCQHCGAKQ